MSEEEETSDELFKEMGYELVEKGYWFLHYEVVDYKKWCKVLGYEYINDEVYKNHAQAYLFDTINHTIAHSGGYVTSTKELLAIIKKCKELGFFSKDYQYIDCTDCQFFKKEMQYVPTKHKGNIVINAHNDIINLCTKYGIELKNLKIKSICEYFKRKQIKESEEK